MKPMNLRIPLFAVLASLLACCARPGAEAQHEQTPSTSPEAPSPSGSHYGENLIKDAGALAQPKSDDSAWRRFSSKEREKSSEYAFQTIDLTAFAARIDAGSTFDLGASFGEAASTDSPVIVVVTWQDDRGATTGQEQILLSPDAEERSERTGPFLKSSHGTVPSGARRAHLTIEATRFGPGEPAIATAGLSLVLQEAPLEPRVAQQESF